MKQKHDELKAAIERGIVDNSKAVGKNDDSGHVLFEGCMSIFCLEEIICVADITGLVPSPLPPLPPNQGLRTRLTCIRYHWQYAFQLY